MTVVGVDGRRAVGFRVALEGDDGWSANVAASAPGHRSVPGDFPLAGRGLPMETLLRTPAAVATP